MGGGCEPRWSRVLAGGGGFVWRGLFGGIPSRGSGRPLFRSMQLHICIMTLEVRGGGGARWGWVDFWGVAGGAMVAGRQRVVMLWARRVAWYSARRVARVSSSTSSMSSMLRSPRPSLRRSR